MSSSASSPSPISYFLAGALLPTLVYVLFLRGKHETKSSSDSGGIDQQPLDDDSSDDEGDVALGESNESQTARLWGMNNAPYKMVLCVNQDLKMGKGKIAAQCCHAAVGCYKRARKVCPDGVRAWEQTGCAKIAVKCPNQDEIEVILVAAHKRGIPLYLVADAGRTQIAAGSRTVLGLGPAPVSAFEGVTSHLKLM
uniref:peptidyl-tRNA hydrolase n=1 Tax=Odontella aurita TaxID=265563 RepID=A0A7S4K0G8_9STRA|mmetsp:Transcript_58631/g.174529  ORF Transcript_58631/g.174529 Transcript_58631/m.174529 type:complete len:196 (+) Transcript_58631:272-859(+)|eukprot:CAMPEP_0113552610 /NCGR_PEP_ID=MMETSP0015_2-20120614/15161_1 /TAXON_ID=2838 /ORGANISM="Odontella" /LENGTH=195 /DNA_ID=CAMNT_0000453603 /DNA_START=184 /DNA_END=771 /DNA_ORIENTATION=+ /assembly_acc=CAM_ASM_000160